MSVEKGFFETIDDVLAEKTNLRLQLPEVTNFYKFNYIGHSEVDIIGIFLVRC